jgi:hypothetical protein
VIADKYSGEEDTSGDKELSTAKRQVIENVESPGTGELDEFLPHGAALPRGGEIAYVTRSKVNTVDVFERRTMRTTGSRRMLTPSCMTPRRI